jgi:hypothetical protein
MRCAIFSTSCSTDRLLLRVAAAAWLSAAGPAALAATVGARIAVFPPVDRTGRSAPVEPIQAALESSLSARGLTPLPSAALEEFFRRHRIRYSGGIATGTAQAIAAETNVEGVLLTSVDDWETVDPPRVALTCRWVTVGAGATLAWMETSAQHGQQRPGAFGLGLVTDPGILIGRAADEIAASLAAFGPGPGTAEPAEAPRRFRPGTSAVDPGWAATAGPDRPLRVAVLPFVADAERRDIGDVIATQFARWLLATGRMEVLEPGVVREALLEARVIQEGGPSVPQVEALHALLDVDLIVSGRVTDYEAMGSSPGTPFLGFSARAIDERTRQIVWSTFSFGRGDDRLGPFGTARIRSSMTLASGLVRGAVAALVGELPSPRRPQGGDGGKEDNP